MQNKIRPLYAQLQGFLKDYLGWIREWNLKIKEPVIVITNAWMS